MLTSSEAGPYLCSQCRAPMPRPKKCCSRKCAYAANNEFTLAARRHYRAWLKSQAALAPMVEKSTYQAPPAAPIGWDPKRMKNRHGPIDYRTRIDRGPAVAMTERAIAKPAKVGRRIRDRSKSKED